MRTLILSNAILLINELRTGYTLQAKEAERIYALRQRIATALRS